MLIMHICGWYVVQVITGYTYHDQLIYQILILYLHVF